MIDPRSLSESQRWNWYFLPDTLNDAGGPVMRNKLGLRDGLDLDRAEYRLSRMRERQLREGAAVIPQTFDAAHAKAIHRHLFQDVYDWAGEYRIVNMSKTLDGPGFADWRGMIEGYLDMMGDVVATTPWVALGRRDFTVQTAKTYALFNAAHPFREGNGRVGKLMMEQIATQTGFTLRLDRVDRIQWNRASQRSLPPLGVLRPNYEELVEVIDTAVDERVHISPEMRELLSVTTTLSQTRPAPTSPSTAQLEYGVEVEILNQQHQLDHGIDQEGR